MYLFSDQPSRIFEPSKGGIGSKLNIANKTLKKIIFKKNAAKIPLNKFDGIKREIFNNIDEIIAKIKLAMTPAAETRI